MAASKRGKKKIPVRLQGRRSCLKQHVKRETEIKASEGGS